MDPTVFDSILGVSPGNEADVHVEIAQTAANQLGAQSVWIANSKKQGQWDKLPVAVSKRTSFEATRRIDVSWSSIAKARDPEVACQVKLARKQQADTEVDLFLADIAFSSFLKATTHPSIDFLAASWIAEQDKLHWNELKKLNGRVELILEPKLATTLPARGADWIKPSINRVEPTTRSQYHRLLSGGTNAKFVGAFLRDGRLRVPFDVVRTHTVQKRTLLLVRAQPAVLECTNEPLTSWWP